MADPINTTAAPRSPVLDELLGNRGGSFVAQSLSDLAVQLLGSGPLAEIIRSLAGFTGYVGFATYAELVDRGPWPLGTLCEVPDTDDGTHTGRTHLSPSADVEDVPNAGRYTSDGTRLIWIGPLTLTSRVSWAALRSLIHTEASYFDSFDIEDGNRNRLISISPEKIDHPDTNAMRLAIAALQAVYGGQPGWRQIPSWLDSYVIEGSDGNRIVEFGPEKIDHPDTNGMRLAIATLQQAMNEKELGHRRMPNGIWIFGDSRQEQRASDPTRRLKTSWSYFNWAQALLGQRMVIVGDTAKSGYRSDQYLTDANVQAAIDSRASYALIFGIVNDIGFWGYRDYWIDRIRPQVLKLINAGIRPIVFTDPGSDTYAANAANRSAIALYNQHVREAARKLSGMMMFDMAAATLDPLQQHAMRAGYALVEGGNPAVHFTTLAASNQGLAFAEFMRPLMTPISQLATHIGDVQAYGRIQVFPNPLFINPTGGGVGTGISGTVPAGSQAACSGPVTATISYSAGTHGNDIHINAVATGEGYAVLATDMPAGADDTGDFMVASIQADVAAGSVNFCGPALLLQASRIVNGVTTVIAATDLDGEGHGPMAPVAMTLDLMTEPLPIPPGTRDWFAVRYLLRFSGAGNASVTLRRPAVRRVLSDMEVTP